MDKQSGDAVTANRAEHEWKLTRQSDSVTGDCCGDDCCGSSCCGSGCCVVI